jgi:hypothetical protein
MNLQITAFFSIHLAILATVRATVHFKGPRKIAVLCLPSATAHAGGQIVQRSRADRAGQLSDRELGGSKVLAAKRQDACAALFRLGAVMHRSSAAHRSTHAARAPPQGRPGGVRESPSHRKDDRLGLAAERSQEY